MTGIPGTIKLHKKGKKWYLTVDGKDHEITSRKPSFDHAEKMLRTMGKMAYDYDRTKTASEAYLGRARARAYKVVQNFERVLASGKKPRTGEEHRIAILQYLHATEQVRDLDMGGFPIHVNDQEVPRMLKVLWYAATIEDNDPDGVWLETLDESWMSPEGKVT